MNIDVVVLWVDGNNSEWKTEKMKNEGDLLHINDARVINNHFENRKQVQCFGEKYIN